jgi:hypothetical protein
MLHYESQNFTVRVLNFSPEILHFGGAADVGGPVLPQSKQFSQCHCCNSSRFRSDNRVVDATIFDNGHTPREGSITGVTLITGGCDL